VPGLAQWNFIEGRIELTAPEFVRTIAGNGAAEIEIRKSRFICTLSRATTEGEARAQIASIRKSNWDASHNCTAWRIGPDGGMQRSNDDGEPSGTAGAPMLEVLNHRKLTDLVAIVTRYFGGTKLGTGGLIRAYGAAVSAAIDHVGIAERRPLQVVTVPVSHIESGRVEHALRTAGFLLHDVAYNAADVTFTVHLEPDQVRPFDTLVAEQTSGRSVARDSGVVFVEVDVREDEVSADESHDGKG